MRLWRVVDEHAAAVKPSYPADWSEAGRALVDVSDAAVTAIGWQLEAGFWDSQGALGNGTGSWRLVVDCEQPIVVMNLLENLTTGHLTNLSPK